MRTLLDAHKQHSNPFIRKLLDVYNEFRLNEKYSKDSLLVRQVQLACHRFNVFPSKSQIVELKFCAVDKKNGRTRKSQPVPFEKFCVLVACLKCRHRRHTFGPLHRYKMARRSAIRNSTDCHFQCSVFLGGSCNPTTWRSDEAIPFLTNANISFYNPQVDDWYPQLIDIENSAKEKASILLFVLDPRTRGIASIVESAYLAGRGMNLVLVIPSETETFYRQDDAIDRAQEQASHKRALSFLTDLVERSRIPIFESLQSALKAIEIMTKKRAHVTELLPSDGVCPVWDSEVSVNQTLNLLWELFRSHMPNSCGRISQRSLCLILDSVCGRHLAHTDNANDEFTFADVCMIYSHLVQPSTWSSWMGTASWLKSLVVKKPAFRYDVFLGGTCATSEWREEVAIPKLQTMGVSYYNPHIRNWSSQFLPYEASAREQCSLLLFVITCDSCSTASMLEAAHFIGKGYRVVLHVDLYPDEQSSSALKDYNRGRRYLMDIASRSNVPVLPTPADAVDFAIQKVLQTPHSDRF